MDKKSDIHRYRIGYDGIQLDTLAQDKIAGFDRIRSQYTWMQQDQQQRYPILFYSSILSYPRKISVYTDKLG